MSEWKTCFCGEEYRTETSYMCDKCKATAKRRKLSFEEYYRLRTGTEAVIPKVKRKIKAKEVKRLKGLNSILKVKPLKLLFR